MITIAMIATLNLNKLPNNVYIYIYRQRERERERDLERICMSHSSSSLLTYGPPI